MKKLTAGIFATILGLTTIDAFAAIPSKGYVDTALAGKQDALTAGANIEIKKNAEGELEISSSYVDTNTTYKAGANIEIKENDKGELEISSSYTDTDTTYTAGNGIKLENGEFSSDIAFTGSLTATTDANGKITVTGTDTTYSAGNGITLENNTFTADVASVSAGTSNVTVTNTDGAVSISVTDSDVAAGAKDNATTGKYALTKIVGEGGVVSYGWELIDRDYVSTDVTGNGQ